MHANIKGVELASKCHRMVYALKDANIIVKAASVGHSRSDQKLFSSYLRGWGENKFVVKDRI